MNIAAMRTEFSEQVSSLASLSDAEIDAYLNAAYQWEVPFDVGGEFTEYLWALTTVASTGTYAYPTAATAPQDSAWISSALGTATTAFLHVETDPSVFESQYAQPSGAAEAQPTAALFFGGSVRLEPVPDGEYVIQIPVRGAPASDITTAGGIDNENHARAVVHAGARTFLVQKEDDIGAARQANEYARYIALLRTQSQSRPNSRRWKRSF